MSDFDDTELPPELSEIGERLAASRPQADGHVLDRTMTRAQAASSAKSSRLWSSGRPLGRKKLIATLASTFVLFGAVGTASAVTVNLGVLGVLLGPIQAVLHIPLTDTTVDVNLGDTAQQQYLGVPCLTALVNLGNLQTGVTLDPLGIELPLAIVDATVACGTPPTQ